LVNILVDILVNILVDILVNILVDILAQPFFKRLIFKRLI